MLTGWGNFYFLLGGASASLIGLMFIVTTLTRSADLAQTTRGQRLYMTPTVFNFAVVLSISAAALAPTLTPLVHEIALGIAAFCGFTYAAMTGFHILQVEGQAPPHWSDPWYYGWFPLVLYVALMASILALGMAREAACDSVALCLLLILLLSVRNAWDLVTWMAPRQNRPPQS